MGKLVQQSIQHFSHPHVLELSKISDQITQLAPRPQCFGCHLQISNGYFYTCRICNNYNLHQSCSQYPQLITHPSHPLPNHHLTLLPTPAYASLIPGGNSGSFQCDACSRRGSAFNYHCSICDFDLHPACASKPMSVTHPYHPSHPLALTFTPPYAAAKGFSCDVCQRVGGQNEWLYRCVACEFDAHLDCATAPPPARRPPPPVVQAPTLQHYNSLPTAATAVQQNYQPQPQPQPQYYMHSASTAGRLQGNYGGGGFQPAAAQNNGNNGLGNTIMTGIIDGMAQQVGQSLMQGILGGGGGNGGGGDGGGGGGGSGDVGGGDTYSFVSYDDSSSNY